MKKHTCHMCGTPENLRIFRDRIYCPECIEAVKKNESLDSWKQDSYFLGVVLFILALTLYLT